MSHRRYEEMVINSDKDGVLALTRKAFDRELRSIVPVQDALPEILPAYEMLGHYLDDSDPTAAYFRQLTGKNESFNFNVYLDDYCTTLRRIGIWRKFPYNGAILALLERIRQGVNRQGGQCRLNVITASGTNPTDRETVGADTRRWLDQCGLTDAHLIHETAKEKYLDCDVWVEDMPRYIIKILKAGFKGRIFLVDHTYNQDHSLRHSLTASQFSRIRRLYPTLEIYRSHNPDPLDVALALGGNTPFQKRLVKRVERLVSKISDDGLQIVGDPNHMEEYFGGSFALAFRSERVDELTSLVGTDAASAMLSRVILRVLDRTRRKTSTAIEQYFISQRVHAFQRGWPIYIHFAWQNNKYLYNMDAPHWYTWFRDRLSTPLVQEKCTRRKAELYVPSCPDALLKKTLVKAFVLDKVPEKFIRLIRFNDGEMLVQLEKGDLKISLRGPRTQEVGER